MNRKLLLLLLSTVAMITSCGVEKKIKTITLKQYNAVTKFGEIVPDSAGYVDIMCYEFNENGQILQMIHEYGDGNKDTIQHIYNKAGLLEKIISPYLGKNYKYDEKGNVVSIISGSTEYKHSYNDKQQLVEVRIKENDTLRGVDLFKHIGDTVVCSTYNSSGDECLHIKVSVKCGEVEQLLHGEYLSRYGKWIKYSAKWENGLPATTENAYMFFTGDGFTICESGYESGEELYKYKFDENGEWTEKIDYTNISGELSPIKVTRRLIEYF